MHFMWWNVKWSNPKQAKLEKEVVKLQLEVANLRGRYEACQDSHAAQVRKNIEVLKERDRLLETIKKLSGEGTL